MVVERSVREETQKKIFNMIEDIHSRIQTEIQVFCIMIDNFRLKRKKEK